MSFASTTIKFLLASLVASSAQASFEKPSQKQESANTVSRPPSVPQETPAAIANAQEIVRKQGDLLMQIESSIARGNEDGLEQALNIWRQIKYTLGINPQIITQEFFLIEGVDLGAHKQTTDWTQNRQLREAIASEISQKRGGQFINLLNLLKRATAVYAIQAAKLIEKKSSLSDFARKHLTNVVADGLSLPIYLRDSAGNTNLIFGSDIIRDTEAFWFDKELEDTQIALNSIYGSSSNQSNIESIISKHKCEFKAYFYDNYNCVAPTKNAISAPSQTSSAGVETCERSQFSYFHKRFSRDDSDYLATESCRQSQTARMCYDEEFNYRHQFWSRDDSHHYATEKCYKK